MSAGGSPDEAVDETTHNLLRAICLVFYRLILVFFRHLKKRSQPRLEELDLLLDPLRTAFAWIPDVSFFAKDKNGKFVAANRAFLKLCGLVDDSELMGKTDLDFFSKKRASFYMQDDRKVLETGVALKNQIEPMPRGKSKTDLITTTKFPVKSGDGRILGIVGIARNLSEISARSAESDEFAKTIDHFQRFSRERFDLRALAARQGMSPTRFERRFKKIFQTTPVAYHLQVRLRQARQHLLSSTKTIGEIALEYGFHDQSHFTKRFVATYGITPSRFRKKAMATL